MKALIQLLEQLGPFRRRKNIQALVATCQKRIQTLHKIKTSSKQNRVLDNSKLVELHQKLKLQRIQALHQLRIRQIINNS